MLSGFFGGFGLGMALACGEFGLRRFEQRLAEIVLPRLEFFLLYAVNCEKQFVGGRNPVGFEPLLSSPIERTRGSETLVIRGFVQ